MKISALKFAAIACAMLFGACSSDKEIVEPAAPQTPVEELVKVEFGASAPETRAHIEVDEAAEKFLCSWDGEDRITVFANNQTGAFTYNPSTKFFEGYLKSTTDTKWNYQAVLPYMATNPLNIPFGAVRTQRGNQFNAQYYPLISERVLSNGTIGKDENGNPVVFKFRSPTAILALTFTTTDAQIGSEKVKSIELQMAGTPIAAESFDLNRISMDGTLSAKNPAQKITMNYEAGTEPAATLARAYFNVPSGEYTDLKVVITTEKHTAEMALAPAVKLAKGELVYATREIKQWTSKAAAPSMSWVENPSFARQEITNQMNIHINAQAEAGIRSFEVKITSATLAALLPSFGFSKVEGEQNAMTQDLASDAPNSTIMGLLFGDPAPATLKGKTEPLQIDLSQLVPMILQLGNATGDHIFTLTMSDNSGRTLQKTLTFFVKPKPAVEFSNINLWTNTATLNLKDIPADAKVEYKRADQTTWRTATGTGATRTIEPRWTTQSNGSEQLDRTYGIFATAAYDWRVSHAGSILIEGQQPAQGTPAMIPTINDATLSCYKTDNTKATFWGSGNNNFRADLCSYQNPFAHLQAGRVKVFNIINIFAPGNLFTGLFGQAGTDGAVEFGQDFDYKGARPSALKVTYKATIGNVTDIKHAAKIAKGAPDQGMIMVCIVDWSARHKTTSGMSAPSGVWNPETREGLTEPEKNGLIAYGVEYIGSTAERTITIPLNFYHKTAAAPSGAFKIIISCATSRYGDYLNGCDTNSLDVRNFEWVY